MTWGELARMMSDIGRAEFIKEENNSEGDNVHNVVHDDDREEVVVGLLSKHEDLMQRR